jgi:hypothetical protein
LHGAIAGAFSTRGSSGNSYFTDCVDAWSHEGEETVV